MDCEWFRVRVRARARSREMDAPGGNSDQYRSPSSSGVRRFGLVSASSLIQAPLSALLEYSGLLRGGNRDETERLVVGRSRDHRGQADEAAGAGNDGEVSIRIIGVSEQEHGREGTGLVVGNAREAGPGSSEVVVGGSPGPAQDGTRDSRPVGEGTSQPNGGGGEAGESGRDSSYQRYDIQQAARWIEQVLPFSLLLLVVFIRQHLQGIAFLFRHNSPKDYIVRWFYWVQLIYLLLVFKPSFSV